MTYPDPEIASISHADQESAAWVEESRTLANVIASFYHELLAGGLPRYLVDELTETFAAGHLPHRCERDE